ncbi:MAG: phosphoribosylformylglycinamidine cyclo-ligase [Nitrospirae bacterium]|nr:phosphoribosylformylglycinamidine cyclo-ligase [Nitrospirota bacterium]
MPKPVKSGRKSPKPLTYKSSGVNIYVADEFVRRIAPLAKRTYSPSVIGHLGASAGLFQPDSRHLKDPILVASADGVGSKILVAEALGKFDTLGFDLVAMNVNDLLTTGARPLFFLDYLAVGELRLKRSVSLVKGIADACKEAECTLLGGETAEMPLVYTPEKFDLAGFAVGIVDRKRLLWRSRVRPGDLLIGLASSGLHSNGYSLALRAAGFSPKKSQISDLRFQIPGGRTLGDELLEPTRIYVKPVLALLDKSEVHAIAHITGGGMVRNLARILPRGLSCRVRPESWPVPPIFRWVRASGGVSDKEMLRTFNMGIGLVLALPQREARGTFRHFEGVGIKAYEIGRVETRKSGPPVVFE